MRSGLPGSARSHGWRQPGTSRCDTVKPMSPAFGFAPRPVAPSSRISPPEPVDAPGNGEIAVGWLCVSTFITRCTGSACVAVDAGRRIRPEPAALGADDDGRVVLVGRQHAARRARVRVADHREQALRRGLAVDQPIGIEDLVAAVLGVRLREHHELDVGGVARQRGELRREILDLVGREREPELAVRALERRAAAAEHVDGAYRLAARDRRTALRASARSVSSVSVMRSCSSGATRFRSAAVSAALDA